MCIILFYRKYIMYAQSNMAYFIHYQHFQGNNPPWLAVYGSTYCNVSYLNIDWLYPMPLIHIAQPSGGSASILLLLCMCKSPVHYGACITAYMSILPSLKVWSVGSCLIFFEIVEIQQWKGKHIRNGLKCSSATGVSSMVSAVKDRQVSRFVSANSKFIVT